MKYYILALVLGSFSFHAFASDAIVSKRFEKIQVQGIAAAQVADSVIKPDGSHAVIRISVDLAIEGNLGFCKFQDFASSLDYRWEEAGQPIYLNVITTACPTPQPLDLTSRAFSQESLSRVITTTFDVDLYDGNSRTITVLNKDDSKSQIEVGFADGKIAVTVKN